MWVAVMSIYSSVVNIRVGAGQETVGLDGAMQKKRKAKVFSRISGEALFCLRGNTEGKHCRLTSADSVKSDQYPGGKCMVGAQGIHV